MPARRLRPGARLGIILLTFALGALPNGLRAQISGLVTDRSGRPVPGATAELWAATQRLSATVTDSAGEFRLVRPAAQSPLSLSVRRIGFATQVLEIAATDTALVLRMAEASILLPAVVAAGRRRICPNREDPHARALWEAMRARYWQAEIGHLPVFGLAEFERDTVPRQEIGMQEMGRVLTGWVEDHTRGWSNVPSRGYASPSAVSVGDRETFWSYEGLDWGGSQHFTQPLFGTLHTFAFAGGAPGQPVISFCPRGRLREKGQIEGTLTLRADNTLAQAGWAFRTREPFEDAGGEASYLPPDPRMRLLLLAESTLFWRKIPAGPYYAERRRFAGWRFMDGSFRPVDAAAEADRQRRQAPGTP